MSEKEKSIGAELAQLIPRLDTIGLRLLYAYGQGLADGNLARDKPDHKAA